MKKIINETLEKIKLFVSFVKDNKEIWVLAYLVWITLQIIILLSILWFAWLGYLSITFSLVLFIIVLSLFFLSIPTFILILITFALIFVFNLWSFGRSWKIILIVLFITLFSIKYFNLFENIRKKFYKKYWDKIDRFYIKYFIFIFWLIFLFMIIATFSFKVATIKYWNNKKVYWKYLFYNQDYYFLDICWKKLVIPSNKVESIEIKTESYKFPSMKKEEKATLNQEYDNYCKKYLNDNK